MLHLKIKLWIHKDVFFSEDNAIEQGTYQIAKKKSGGASFK